MDLLPRNARHVHQGMVTLLFTVVICTCMCVSSSAFPTQDFQVKLRRPEYSSLQRMTNTKRGRDMVDAWALCPPDMEQMDCFYTYLRLYARLRKAARETDRVSMRNIGKRVVHPTHFGFGKICSNSVNKKMCLRNIIGHNNLYDSA